MKTRYKIFTLLLLFIMQFAIAQEKSISGTVTDGTNPLPGVSVIVKGTSVGATTDFDGKYIINADAGDVLQFSYVGMSTEEVTIESSSKPVDVEMQADNTLKEVVVTAMGQSRGKKSLSFSASVVGDKDLSAAQNPNAVSALSGKVAGLKINSPSGNLGGSQRILIRGANSITGENQPLFVIDGIPMDNSNFNTKDAQRGSGGVDFGSTINDINPDSIESLTVLKGAAAALYGSRASNGVILITTKKGKSSEGIGVTVNSSVTRSSVSILPRLQKKYGGGSIVSDRNGGKDGFVVKKIDGKDYSLVQYATDESWGPKYDPNIKVLHWDAFDEESFPDDYLKPRPWVASPNDVDSFFETGISIKNNVTLTSRTNDKGSFLLSAGQETSTGTVPNTKINKHFARFSLNQKLSEKLTATSSINYVQTKGVRAIIGYDGNSVTQKFFQWGQRQLDFKRLENYKNKDGTQRTWNRSTWNDSSAKYSDNPYWTVYKNTPSDERFRTYGSVGLNYQVTNDFSVKGSVYGDVYNFRNSERISTGSQDQSKYLERVYDFQEYNYEFIASYKRDLMDNLKVSMLVGGNRRDNQTNYRKVNTTGGLAVSDIYNIKNGKGPVKVDTYNRLKKVNSVFGSLNFEFADQLFVDLTARNDWSSTLPDDNNSYFYPSASVAWVFTDALLGEKKNDIFNYGKFRFGWAQIGNDAKPYKVETALVLDVPFKGVGRATVPSTLLNPKLKNETTTTLEVGAELIFLKNRINLDFTYYSNATTDQIIPIDISLSSGYGSQWINAGKMTNKGIEIQLGVKAINTGDFKWDFNVNFSKNENMIIELKEGLNSILISEAPFAARLVARKGEAYGTIMGTDFIYDDKGNKVISDKGKYKSTNDLVPLGSVLPDFIMGFNNTFRYKNFTLGALFEWSKGGQYFSTSHQWGMYSGMLEETAAGNIREEGLVLKGVTRDEKSDGKGGKIYTNIKPNTIKITAQDWAHGHYKSPSAQNVFDASFFKLREMTLSYAFTGDVLKIFKKVEIGLFGRNLYTWGLDYDGIDPETVSTGSGNTQGLEGGLQPAVRSSGINIKLSF